MKAITKNDLLEALRVYGRAAAKRPEGEGWFTIRELADAEDVSPATIQYRMKLARERGVKFDTASGSQVDERGKVYRAIYFRLRNGKP